MAERVQDWWARRQFSRGRDVPYEVGTYREAWAPYPVLIRQYHPDLNAGITLTQIPPAADVLLLWQCDAGHLFVATPTEQRSRPTRERRRSAWCPECALLANPPRVRPRAPVTADPPREARRASLPAPSPPAVGAAADSPGSVTGLPATGATSFGPIARGAGAPAMLLGAAGVGPGVPSIVSGAAGSGPGVPSRVSGAAGAGSGVVGVGSGAPVVVPGAGGMGSGVPGAEPGSRAPRARARRRSVKPLCAKTPDLPVGEPFLSACAPTPASAVEARMRADLFGRLAVTPGLNAVRVARPFFDHLEVWPDILLPELRIALEYDSTGRHGLEHVGKREEADRRKDRALRAAGWEVVRVRTGRLERLGPHDLVASAWNRKSMGQLIDTLREIRGPLLVDAYLR